MKVLLIEDDKSVREYICKGMKEAGHEMESAEDGQTGLDLAKKNHYDVIIVDRMLPKMDGLTILRLLRAEDNSTPALILSALGEVDDRVEGLRSGGDDYLVKPFAFVELLARIEVLSKRHNHETSQVTTLHAGDVTMDLISRKVTVKGENVILQTREFNLLEYLVRNQGQVVTRTMLLEAVWDYHFDPQTNVIDVHISRLRKKIEDTDGSFIKTVRGAGYIIEND